MHESQPRFDLSAGVLCLDFANTWQDRSMPASEELETYTDLIAFLAQARVIGRREVASLQRLAAGDPHAARAAFDGALQLRESIYCAFSAVASDRKVPAAAIDRLNRGLCADVGRLRLRRQGSGFALRWSGLGDALQAPLRPVAHTAAELLTSPDLVRVRECGGDHCDWLFLDRSRNRSRRWCSMETCGNRSKARRHYHRQKRP